jgi:ribosomal-protein-alanine N-acetyltransferase
MLIETAGSISIVAATFGSLDAEDAGGAEVARLLGVRPPPSWPPQYNGPETREWIRGLMRKHPGEPGYASWYLIADGELVGAIGYKGPPDADGIVEIGYAVVDERHRHGYASAGVALVTKRAFADPRVRVVAAETLPDGLASQGVLLKAGFTRTGSRIDADDGEVWRFVRKR